MGAAFICLHFVLSGVMQLSTHSVLGKNKEHVFLLFKICLLLIYKTEPPDARRARWWKSVSNSPLSECCTSEPVSWCRWSHFFLISLRLSSEWRFTCKERATSLIKMPWLTPLPLFLCLSLSLLPCFLQLPTAWSLLLLTKRNPLRLLCLGQLACWSGGRPPTACGCSREYQVQSECIYWWSGPSRILEQAGQEQLAHHFVIPTLCGSSCKQK